MVFTRVVIVVIVFKKVFKVIKIKVIDISKIIKIKKIILAIVIMTRKTIIKSRNHHIVFVSETSSRSDISQSFKMMILNIIEKTPSFSFFNIDLLNDLNEKKSFLF